MRAISLVMSSALAADPSMANGSEVRAGSSRDGDLEDEEGGRGSVGMSSQKMEVGEAPQGYRHIQM